MAFRFTIRNAAISLLVAGGAAQITLTGCHIDNGQEVCLLPGGAETTIVEAGAPSPTAPTSAPAETTSVAQTTAVTDCHNHGTTPYCVKGNGDEVEVRYTHTGDEPAPTAFTDCHPHGSATYCLAPNGEDVEIVDEAATEGDPEAEGGENCHFHAGVEHCGDHGAEEEEGGGENCHFHAGVEHCGDHGAEEEEGGEENCHFHAGVEHCGSHGSDEGSSSSSSSTRCERRDRDYDVPLRIGLLFVVLVTSAIGVYAPLLMRKLLKVNPTGTIFTIVKQFGTGVIISTALIHLMTHAELMWSNSCLGGLIYEATATAVAMAGAFIAFLIDFLGHRMAHWRRSSVAAATATRTNSSNEESSTPKETTQTAQPVSNLANLSHHSHDASLGHPNDGLSVFILEAGIIFHSLLLGITLVVAGDSFFITLFIVIVFHQIFEGLALGARIAAIDGLKMTKYILLPLAFAFVTPVGMAIGIGVLNTFNGNDPSTIIALGTLDSLSAGILMWVGFVSMWGQDWMYGELREAGLVKTTVAMISLMGGMALMGLLGKWA